MARPRTQRNGRGHLNQINEDVRKHHLDRIRGPAHSLGVFHRRTDTIGLKGVLKELNYQTMSAHPIEVKSGKDYQEGKITYMPVYFVMFFDERTEADMSQTDESEYIF